jgi:sugar phosphate isomerase/epimerase
MEFARDIGAELFNIHLHNDEGMEAYVEAVKPVIRAAAESCLLLSIENTPVTSPEDFNTLFSLLRDIKELDTRHVGMCLDLGHANLHGSTRNDYLGFIDRLDGRVPIIHIHLHENFGDRDSHLPLFTGPSADDPAGVQGFVGRIVKRGFSGCMVLEQWPAPPGLLDRARERLCRIIDSEVDDFTNKSLNIVS